ncbi:MAG: glycosyltransferase family 2 protein [Candidatus Ancaeobacter aquaticus]|nr:glycosyltransferase family 2 protein [Candidatus Ancaeobacter aquaticus]
MNSPLVSFMIINWNGKNYLEKCFTSIQEQTYPHIEVIMVDNGSSDDSILFTESSFPTVRIIKNTDNLGYVIAKNQAAKSAQGTYLFSLDSDTHLDRFCVENLVKEMESDSRIGMCACHLKSYAGASELSCGFGCDFFSTATYNDKEPFFSDGAGIFIRKDLYIEIGGFDETHFMYKEDVDLGWRVNLMGYRVFAAQKAIVYHMSGGVSGIEGKRLDAHWKNGTQYETNYRRRYLGEKNSLRNVLKNYSSLTLIWMIPLYVLVSVAEMLLFLCVGQPKTVLNCYLKAYGWNIRHLADTIKEHNRMQRLRKVGDLTILRKMDKRLGKYLSFRKMKRIPIVK